MRLRKHHLIATVSLSVYALPALAQVRVPLPGHAGTVATAPPAAAPAAAPSTSAPAAAPPPQNGRQSATVPLPGAPAIPLTPEGRPDINPYNRDIDLTVPVTYRDRTLGELPIHLTADDHYWLATKPFLDLLKPLLNPKAAAKLQAALGSHETFGDAELAGTGISLTYDPSALAVVVIKIDATERAIEFLFPAPGKDEDMPDLAPEKFSAFLNVNVIESKMWGNDDRLLSPSVYLDGAIRFGGVVLEGDGEFSDQFGLSNNSNYEFDRNYVRLVYDQPEKFRRFFAGDLQPEIRGQQTFVRMGGIGVSRERRRFDQFRSAILQGNRQIVLQRASTIDVYRNGALLRQFHLDPGSYDLSTLPLIAGSNDISIQVRDNAGVVQTVAYNSYLDPIDLEPGDYEYGAYFGKTSTIYGRSPVYNGDLAFSGFFRKAFVNKPAVGVGLQASKTVQNVVGQTQFILPNSSRIQFDLAGSRVRRYGGGFSAGVSYDLLLDRGDKVDAVTLRADYISRRYAGLGNEAPDNPSSWSVSANYTRTFTQEITAILGLSYIKGRGNASDSYRIDATTSYRFSPKWSVRGGVNYTYYGGAFGRQNGLGFNIALVFQPSYRDRAEARYESNTDDATVSYTHSPSGLIGSVGYGAIAGRDYGSANAQAFADYTGNRFDASLSQSAYGENIGRVGDQQITTVRVGTSLAFAGGHFGLGRRISDSFAVLYPHPTLKGHSVVAGQSLAKDDYMSKSGTFGGAVNGYLNSYTLQSIQYDVEDPPRGYDIGSGVVRVKPPYKSGYALEIGTDAFVSATGTLDQYDGKPVSLAGGRVTALDGKSNESMAFFTNSIGRFAVQNLRPGVTYRVDLFGRDQTFQFSVPKTTTGLVDLKTIKLKP
ncbi:MAG: hypothetical protein ACTHMG_00540 [Sphingomonas sp.]